MGWPSYLEDKIRRFDESLFMAQTALDDSNKPPEYIRSHAIEALERARALWNTIYEHLDLATSPELNIANQLIIEREACKDLRSKLDSALAAQVAAKNETAKALADSENLKKQLHVARREKNKAEADFMALQKRSQPGSAMEALLSSKGRGKSYKGR